MKKTIPIFTLCLALTGCAMPDQRMNELITTEKRDFTYDYTIKGVDKNSLFKRARNHLATAVGDSKDVIRVEDAEQGVLIGRASASWIIHGGMGITVPCYSSADFYFIAKDEKAHLSLKIVEGIPVPAACKWPLPSRDGYTQIVQTFENWSNELGTSLKEGSTVEQLGEF